MKTASFGFLIIKIPARMLSVQNRLDTEMFRVHQFSFFTTCIKTPRPLVSLYMYREEADKYTPTI